MKHEWRLPWRDNAKAWHHYTLYPGGLGWVSRCGRSVEKNTSTYPQGSRKKCKLCLELEGKDE